MDRFHTLGRNEIFFATRDGDRDGILQNYNEMRAALLSKRRQKSKLGEENEWNGFENRASMLSSRVMLGVRLCCGSRL